MQVTKAKISTVLVAALPFLAAISLGPGPQEGPVTVVQDSVTFNAHIARILYANCTTCHHPGGSGPFSLMTFEDAAPRAALIAQMTADRRMPPWLPEAGYGAFAGERGLTDQEIALIQRWVGGGAPEGGEHPAPVPPTYGGRWQLGEPDLVVRVPPFDAPATGTDVYRNLVVAAPVAAPRYVSTVELRPGGQGVVHHARMMVDVTSSSRELDAEDGEPGFDGMELVSNATNPTGHFIGWTPGRMPYRGRDDLAWRLDPGTDFVLQLHLRPSGVAQRVEPEIGLHFAGAPPPRAAALVMLGSAVIDIPPGATDYEVRDEYELPVDVEALSVYPHAHYLGALVEGYATLPNGRRRWLVRIPDWDFNWQDEYRFREPIDLPAGTVLTMRWLYDNSAANPQNPNRPPRRVVYGSNSTDEMSDLVVQVVPKRPSDLERLVRDLAWKDERREIAYFVYDRHRRGRAALEAERWDEAVALLQEAVQYRADDAAVLGDLARAFVGRGDGASAVFIAERAVTLSEAGDVGALRGAAAAYAAVGRRDEAIAAAERALRLARRSGATEPELIVELRAELEGYRRPR